MAFQKIFLQKIISFVLVFSTIFSIGAPAVYAEGFFSFGKKETKKQIELPVISREKLVAVLVEEKLLNIGSLGGKIERYAKDVQNKLLARSILIPVPENASPREIQEGLAQFYFSGYENNHKSQLIGTVLIGDVPIPVVDKGGGLNPAIFPYTDFENVNYEWDYEQERFKWVGGDNEPEIWHGLIRSDLKDFDARVKELEKYFDQNHKVHQEKIAYPKKVFFADFFQQRKGISEKQKRFYENWINNLGDFMYMRFNKHWLKELMDEEVVEIPQELLPSEAQGADQSVDFSAMPDIFAKNPIETMSMRYLSANEGLITKINEQIEIAGRWKSRDIDTTISLISKKDEWAANVLKAATDEVENIFITKSRENNVATDITVPLETVVEYFIGVVPHIKYFPENWVGVPMEDLDEYNWLVGDTSEPTEYPAENCSLYRGTVRTDGNSIAQKVEISRVFNPYLFDEDPDDRCMGKVDDEEIIFDECRFADYVSYAGNMSLLDTMPLPGSWAAVNDPVFEHTGSREISNTNYDGASGCEPIILELQPEEIEDAVGQKETFSSLMVHNEPTVDTIKAMVNGMTANDIPVDPHHGISFYDTDYDFHRVNFPSAFDLINKRNELDSDFDLLTKTELEQNLSNTIAEINATAGNTDKIQESFFADSYWLDPVKQNELIEAIKWLGTDLEKKNIEMFLGALSSTNTGRETLKQSNYDGYELAEIRGELSDIEPNGGIKIAFERGEEKPTDNFVDAKNESLDLDNYGEVSSPKSRENLQLQKEFEEIFAENKTDPACSGKNLLTWPTACLIPWVQKLPNVFTKITKLIPNVDLEKEDETGDENLAKNEESLFSLSSAVLDESVSLTDISADPATIKFSNTDRSPQKIQVSLKDENGEIIASDYQTKIEFITNSSDAETFFSVLPDKKVIAKKGQATFYLMPKKQSFGGQVNLKFRGNSIDSNSVSVNVSTKKLEAFADKDKLIAGETTGSVISVKIFDNEGKIDHSLDGRILEFSSENGGFHSEDFTSGNRALVENGISKILFLPGIRAGEAIIEVQDEAGILPVEKVYLDIVPGKPAKIDFIKAPAKLVKNGDYLDFFAGISDKYGNLIPELAQNIKWIAEGGLEIKEKIGGKNQVKLVEKNLLEKLNPQVEKIILSAEIDQSELKSREKNNKFELSSENKESSSNLEKLKISREISLVEFPNFDVSIPETNLIAGSNEKIKLKIQAKEQGGEILKNDFKAQVIVDDKEILDILPEILFSSGVAELEISPKFKSGISNVRIIAPGFIESTFSLQVLPADPYLIKINTDKTDLNADSQNPLDLEIEVLDEYGNIADFNDEIEFKINPPESFEGSAQELKDLGVFNNPATADSFIQGQQNSANSAAEEEIATLDSDTLTLSSGKGTNKINPLGVGGKIYLIATHDGLKSGAVELDITKVLSRSDLKYLSPKSLLTLLLGVPAGDLNNANIGNRFLFDGQTQAVATTLNANSAKKVLGHIFADFKFSPELSPQIFAGNKFSVRLNDLAQTKITFAENPKLSISEKLTKKEGLNFYPAEDISIENFDLESREIFYNEQSLFSVHNQGGIIFTNSKVSFEPIKNSLLDWTVFFENKELGQLHININDLRITTEVEEEELKENVILIKSERKDIEIKEVFNGKTTTDSRGLAIVSKTEQEERSKILGSPNFDLNNDELGWTSEWKGASFFAGKNSVGDSVKWGSGDSFILLGDPTLSVPTENEKSDLNINQDMGDPLWKSPWGVIDEITTGDLNYDNKAEVFVRSGEKLFALYHDKNNLDNFRDIGEILRFGDGAKKVAAYNKNNGDLAYLIQLNEEGNLVFHKNINGVFSREKIDLGITSEIEKFKIAKLNSDEFKDLVVLDNSNRLYFVYGRENGFYSAQKLDSAAAIFEQISEKYFTTDGQNFDEKIFHPEKFRYLQNFFAGFSGAENYSWTGKLNTVGNLQFLPVTENKAFDIRLEIEQENPNNLEKHNLKVENGAKFTQKLFIYPKETDLNDFQLIVPNLAGFKINFDSFSTTNCVGTPEITQKEDSFLITNCNISKNTLAKLSWELTVKEVPLINFMVEDFEGNDGIDDIVIPWKEEGKKKFIQYLSYGNSKMYPPNFAKKTVDSPESPIVKTHLKKIVDAFPEGTKFPTDFSPEDSAQDMLDCMKDTDDGLPEFYFSFSVDDLLFNMSSKGVYAGLQVPSVAFLAPGPQSIYIPPFSFPNPMSSMGKPALWIGTLPPYVGSMVGQYPSSLFRLYLMPTTTLRLGIGICGGPIIDPLMTPTGIPFPPQCFVIVPPLRASSDGSGGDGGDESSSNNCAFENPANSSGANVSKNNFLLNVFAGSSGANFGSFSPQVGSYSKNLQIIPPDIITTWVKAQMKEFGNYKFPKFDIILPNFPKPTFGGKGMKPLDRLSQSPYFEIKREKMEINYPKFSREKLEKLDTNFSSWKVDSLSQKDLLKVQLSGFDNLSFDNFDQDLERVRMQINSDLTLDVDFNSPDFQTLPPELKTSIQEEFSSVEAKAEELKATVNQKIDELKGLPKELVNSAKNKIQEQIDEIEKIETTFENNLEALKSYQEEIDNMKKLPQKIKKATKEMVKINGVIGEYWSSWTEKNKKSVQEWKNFSKKTTAIIKTWNDIPEIFKIFSTSCTPGGGGGTTSVNRGTLITWLMKILLSAIKLPVIPMPHFPDIVVDLSKVNIGATLTVPEISFRPVKLVLPKLPNSINFEIDATAQLENSLTNIVGAIPAKLGRVPNFALDSIDQMLQGKEGENLSIAGNNLLGSLQSYNTSLSQSLSLANNFEQNFAGNFIDKLPTIQVPNLPTLPALPSVIPKVEVPTIDLPQLPTLLPPPKFPNFLKPITTVVSVIKPFFKNILSGLSLGIIPIPEWKVASRVVQLTNRTSLLPMDFVPSAQLPDVPKIPVSPIKISPEVELVPAFDSFNAQIKGVVETMNNLTNAMSTMGRGGSPSFNNIVPEGIPISQKSREIINDEKVVVNIFNEVPEPDEINNEKILAKIEKMVHSSDEIKPDIQQQPEKTKLEKMLANYQGLLASTEYISSSDTPDYLPEDFDTSAYDGSQKEPYPISKLYYFSSADDKSEPIINFPVNGKIHYLEIADLDEDGEEEILYSLNKQLFLKRRVHKNLTAEEQNSVYDVPDNLITQNFAEFSESFAPVETYSSETDASESSIEFLPPKSSSQGMKNPPMAVSYFEWVISERPDRIFDEIKNNKFSKYWQRVAFLIRPKGHKYEIRKGNAKINKVKGSPILYGNALKEIAKFSSTDCHNDEIIKPFFPQETILVGKAKESKFQVKTKKRAGQQEETRDIILRAGEETIVDFAEICLMRGEVSYLDLEKIEKFTPQAGNYFFSNMRLELGKNDEVELSLYDDTKINVYGGEKYELHSFNSREKFIKNYQKLSLSNYYGELISFNSDNKSFTRSKNLLHDPQLSDDEKNPKIILTQGNKIKAFITEPIEIDASQSYDDQKIARVWWTKDGKIILDSNKGKHSITESLKIQIPAKFSPENFSVTLNIIDESGNLAVQEIPVEVIAPNLEISGISLRDQKIIGRIKEERPNIQIGFLRERNGREDVLEQIVKSGKNGIFEASNLGTSGRTLLKDKNTGEVLAEILPTGRPVILNTQKATLKVNTNPLSLEITDSKLSNLAIITLKSSGKNDAVFDSFAKEIPAKKTENIDSVYVVDADNEDGIAWKKSSNGFSLLDNLNQKTLGILTNNGDFSGTNSLKESNLSIRLKKAEKDSDSVIFEILNRDSQKVFAEFFIPVGEVIVQ